MAHTGGRVQEQRKERARLVHRARNWIQDVLPLGAGNFTNRQQRACGGAARRKGVACIRAIAFSGEYF